MNNIEKIFISLSAVHLVQGLVPENVQIVITQYRIRVLSSEGSSRQLLLNELEAITVSFRSNELVIHSSCSHDFRLQCLKNKTELVRIIYYVLALSSLASQLSIEELFLKQLLKVYIVNDLSLGIYTTTEEDVSRCCLRRPPESQGKMMRYQEYVDCEFQ